MCNLKFIEASRKKIRQGDIFAVTLDHQVFYFGRVIFEGITFGGRIIRGEEIPGWPNCTFCYLYADSSPSLDQVSELSRDRLLIAPFATNHLGWRRGYFKTVASREIRDEDILHQHCFKDLNGEYRDLDGGILKTKIEPCGVYALRSYRTVDDAISIALGVPLAPD